MALGLNSGIRLQCAVAGILARAAVNQATGDVSDNFSWGNDGTPLNNHLTELGGKVWSDPSNNWTLQGNKAQHSGTSGDPAFVDAGPGNSDRTIQTTLSTLNAYQLLRYTDSTHYFYVGTDGSGNTQIWEVNGGAPAAITVLQSGGAAGDVFTSHTKRDKINVLRGASPMYALQEITHNQTATKFGIYSATNGANLDSLSITPLPTTNPQVICDGDSLTAGSGIVNSGIYPFQLWQDLAASGYIVWNEGTSGDTLANMITNAAANVDVDYAATHSANIVVIWAGTNDVNGTTSLATMQTNIQTYCNARRAVGWKVVVVNMLPRATFDAGREAIRVAYNTWLSSNWSFFADGYADVAAEANLQNTADTTYFTDGTHLTAAGYTIVKNDVKASILNQIALVNPTVTAISPATAANSGTQAVTITGTGFVTGATAKVGTTALTGVSFVSSTSLTATVPSGISAGTYDVIVTNPTPSFKAGKLTNGFVVTAAGTNITASFTGSDGTALAGTTTDTGGKTFINRGAGTYRILSNQARMEGANGNTYLTVDSGISDGTIQVTMATISGPYNGISFRITDANNGFYFEPDPDGTLNVQKIQGGSSTILASFNPGAYANGDVYKIVLLGSSIKAYRNGTLIITTSSTFNQTATEHGLFAYNYQVALFDNLSIVG
jgi:lysophospholipase L1-like esterase